MSFKAFKARAPVSNKPLGGAAVWLPGLCSPCLARHLSTSRMSSSKVFKAQRPCYMQNEKRVSICISIYIYVCIHMCTCVHVYIHRHMLVHRCAYMPIDNERDKPESIYKTSLGALEMSWAPNQIQSRPFGPLVWAPNCNPLKHFLNKKTLEQTGLLCRSLNQITIIQKLYYVLYIHTMVI